MPKKRRRFLVQKMITDTLIVCIIAEIQRIGIAVTIAGTAAMTLFIFLRR